MTNISEKLVDIEDFEPVEMPKVNFSELRINVKCDNWIEIYASSSETPKDGMKIVFREDGKKKYMKTFQNGDSQILNLDISNNLSLLAIEHFKNLLRTHQSQIKKLDVGGQLSNDINFGNINLENLEVLTVSGSCSGRKLFSMAHGPLKELIINLDKFDELEMQKIYRVRSHLHIDALKLNYQQFKMLHASTIKIHIGYLTPGDIYKFIQSWQKERLDRKYRNIQLHLMDSDFDTKLLLQMFLGEEYDGSRALIFKQFTKNKKRARLCTAGNALTITFYLDQRDEPPSPLPRTSLLGLESSDVLFISIITIFVFFAINYMRQKYCSELCSPQGNCISLRNWLQNRNTARDAVPTEFLFE